MRVTRVIRYIANQPSLWKGIAAGAIGGFAAAWTMSEFHVLESSAVEKTQRYGTKPAENKDSQQSKSANESESVDDDEGAEDDSMKAAGGTFVLVAT